MNFVYWFQLFHRAYNLQASVAPRFIGAALWWGFLNEPQTYRSGPRYLATRYRSLLLRNDDTQPVACPLAEVRFVQSEESFNPTTSRITTLLAICVP